MRGTGRRGTSPRRSSSAPCSGARAGGCSARRRTSAACAPAGRTPRARSFRGGLLREELADGVPDVFLRREVAGTHRQARALELAEDLGELRVARSEARDAAGLDVAGIVHLPRDVGKRAARLVAVLG